MSDKEIIKAIKTLSKVIAQHETKLGDSERIVALCRKQIINYLEMLTPPVAAQN